MHTVRRRLLLISSLPLMALVTTACSSSGTTTSTTTSSGGIPTTAAAPTTTLPGTLGPGTPQTATGPSAQKITATPTNATHHGALVGGPPGSWVVGLVVSNGGPGPFTSTPSTQVALVSASGQQYHPVSGTTPQTGGPTALPVGGQVRMLLFFTLPDGGTPTAVVFTPFGTAAPALRWNP